MSGVRDNNCFIQIRTIVDAATDQKWNEKHWGVFAEAWVSIKPDYRGREVSAANETTAIVTHIIRGDFLDLENVTEKMIVIYHASGNYDPVPNDAKVYDILAVMPDENARQDVMLKAQHFGRRFGDLVT